MIAECNISFTKQFQKQKSPFAWHSIAMANALALSIMTANFAKCLKQSRGGITIKNYRLVLHSPLFPATTSQVLYVWKL